MKKLVISALTACVLTVSPALWGSAQEQQKPAEKQKRGQAERQTGDSYTGCLTEQAGAYSLKVQGGDSVALTGSADLSKHKNHTVRITGKMSEEGGKKTLNVENLEHVSASCTN